VGIQVCAEEEDDRQWVPEAHITFSRNYLLHFVVSKFTPCFPSGINDLVVKVLFHPRLNTALKQAALAMDLR
jgi:hypothetical protein